MCKCWKERRKENCAGQGSPGPGLRTCGVFLGSVCTKIKEKKRFIEIKAVLVKCIFLNALKQEKKFQNGKHFEIWTFCEDGIKDTCVHGSFSM